MGAFVGFGQYIVNSGVWWEEVGRFGWCGGFVCEG